jgi:hypothetical protein
MPQLLDGMLGCCTHPRCTWPMRAEPGQRCSGAAGVTGIYVVCLDCGQELAYSWDEMKVVSASSRVKPRCTMPFPNLSAKVAEELSLWR